MFLRFVAVVAVSWIGCPVVAQVPLSFEDWNEIDYRGKVVKTCANCVKNHRVIAVHKTWDFDKAKYREQTFSQSEHAAIHGADAWVEVVQEKTGTGAQIEYVKYVTLDAQYFMSNNSGKRPHTLKTFATEWKDRSAYTQSFNYFSASRQFHTPRPDEKIISHEKSTFEGSDQGGRTSNRWDPL
jgi:hypothetical protein